MIKFKIEEKEYKVPDFISVEHYSKIYKIKDLFSDDYFAARLLNIVSDAPIEELLESDYQEEKTKMKKECLKIVMKL